jgi:transcriptional regulator with XRE-family HTH domain
MDSIKLNLRKDIGRKISFFRNNQQFTRKKMASELKMSLRGYSAIENGEVSVTAEKLMHISSILSINPISLYPETSRQIETNESIIVRLDKIECQIQEISEFLKQLQTALNTNYFN